MRVSFPRIALLLACAVSLTLTLAAQSPNGTINGRVLDSSNKVIGGADILVINDATGVQYSGKTNDDGIYVVSNLPPGPYRLQVSKAGFKTLIKPDIVLNIQDALSINFTLPIGAVFEIVTVEGGASMINTTDASVSTVVDSKMVENMPLNGRSFQDLILLTPGIVTNSPQNGGALGMTGEFSVNGQRTDSNYYTVDGVGANLGAAPSFGMIEGAAPSGSLGAATALGTTQSLVSVEDLQEFRVQSSTYSAEYGRNPGGHFAFETKSGTNQWHGTAFDYLRNNYFDANDWFNNYFRVNGAALRQNDFGGTLGGPVEVPRLYNGRDKTFFFVSYEGLRLDAPQAAANIFVPDATLRANTPAPLNQVLDTFPVQRPNGVDDTANGIAQFIGTWSNPSSINSTSVRFDHTVSGKLRLFFRFSDTGSSSSVRGFQWGVPQDYGTSAFTSRTYTAGANGILSDHFSNDFRLNYSSNFVTTRDVISAFGGGTPVNLFQLTGLGGGADPSIDIISGPYFIGIGETLGPSGAQKQWNMVDTASLSLGRHQFKFGVDYRRLTPLATFDSPEVSYVYLSVSEVEANNPPYAFSRTLASAYPLYMNLSAFAQDEWKASQRLSLSLGLRWDVNPPPGVTQGLKPYTLQGTGPDNWALAPQGTPLWHTTWYNLAPRLGLAYTLHSSPGHETVVRGGGGIFFDTGQQLGSLGFNGPGFSQFGPDQSLPFPVLPVIANIVNPPVAPYGQPAEGFAPHLQLPYTLQWNASIEQAFGNSQAFTVTYVGSHGARLLQQNEFNSSVNPNASAFFFNENGLTSDYDSLQIQFRRRLSRGLTALASYTWSHCLDYGSTNFDIGYQRGNCSFDVRHNFSTAFSYQLPNFGHGELVNAVLHHWGLDDRFTARTAFPVNITGGTIFDPVTEKGMSAGADLVSGQPTYLYGANCNSAYASLYGNTLPCPGGRAINPCAFVVPGSLPGPPCTTNGMGGTVLGLAPRNFVRGFGAWQMDLAVRREFPIYENLKLQFRAEAFNIFNHPNFGIINASIGQSTFGQPTATLANSLGILSPLYQMGGPRSIQFAVKIIF